MGALLLIARGIDLVTAFVGRAVYWLVLAAVLVSAGNAVIRKLFDMSSNAWLELQWYLFAAVFMLSAAYALQRNQHIRIDIVSGLLPERARNWIDVIGHALFLLPMTVVMVYQLLPWTIDGIRSGEMSSNAGGLVLWPARLIILGGFALLFFQGLSELIKRIAFMARLIPDPYADHAGPRRRS